MNFVVSRQHPPIVQDFDGRYVYKVVISHGDFVFGRRVKTRAVDIISSDRLFVVVFD
jgi:hypothetical protein